MLIAFGALLTAAVHAQPADTARGPWPLAAVLGTGRYEIAPGTDALALRYAPRVRLRDAALNDDGERRVGIELRVPVSASVYRADRSAFDNVPGLADIGSLSVVPGAEIDIPLGPRASIKPLAYVGAGKALDAGPWARIYWLGIKSRQSWSVGRVGVDLITSLVYAGYRADDLAGDVAPLRVGIELTKPMRSRDPEREPLHWHWHIAHRHYLDDTTTNGPEPARLTIDDEFELGVAIGPRRDRFRLGPLAFDRIGIALQLDRSGDHSGFRLVFTSLYEL